MSSRFFFSIVIPVYNRVSTLKRALRSIEQQSFEDFELIVVDDGSSVDFANEIKALVEASDVPNKKLIRYQENRNGAYARNRGVEEAKGRYVCLLDSDDEWTANKLEVTYQYIQGHPESKLVYHQCLINAECAIPTRGKRDNELLTDFMFVAQRKVGAPTSTICFKRDVFEKVKFDENLSGHQDWDFCLKLEKEKIPFEFIAQALTIRHRSTSDSVGASITGDFSYGFYLRNNASFSLQSSVHFFKWVVLPKLCAENRYPPKIMMNRIMLLLFILFPMHSFQHIRNARKKARSLHQRLRRSKSIAREKRYAIFGDNYYALQLISTLPRQPEFIIDSNPKRDDVKGISVLKTHNLAWTDFDNIDVIILATDRHADSMMESLSSIDQQLEQRVMVF